MSPKATEGGGLERTVFLWVSHSYIFCCIPRIQGPDFFLRGATSHVVCVNNPEKHDNVSFGDTEQAHLVLAIEEQIPQGEYSSAMRQTNCVSNIHLDHTVVNPVGFGMQGGINANMMLILLTVS